MSGLSGRIASLARFAADLRRLPRVVAQKVTAASAPVLTALALNTFEASENAYGGSWSPGSRGQRVTLVESGALERGMRYVAIGTKLRVALAVRYAKYQIGRRPVFPAQGGQLPVAYSQALQRTAVDVVREELGQ